MAGRPSRVTVTRDKGGINRGIGGRQDAVDACTAPRNGFAQLTSELSEARDFRVTIEPTERNGLQVRSQVMADKPVTIRRERIGGQVGRLEQEEIARLNIALAFVMGLAD